MKEKDRGPKSDPAKSKSIAGATFPFSAIVAQEEMKLALLLNAIDPSIGGRS